MNPDGFVRPFKNVLGLPKYAFCCTTHSICSRLALSLDKPAKIGKANPVHLMTCYFQGNYYQSSTCRKSLLDISEKVDG